MPNSKTSENPVEISLEHTPGPWFAFPDSTCSGAWLSIRTSEDGGGEIAQTGTFASSKDPMTSQTIQENPDAFEDNFRAGEVRANAALIAAAPELLAALESVISVFNSQRGRFREAMPESPRLEAVEEAISEACKTIAKAKGAKV
jgi:hypothetical protein